MASKQPLTNQPTDSANHLIGQFNQFQLNQLNVNQPTTNQLTTTQLTANQLTATQLTANQLTVNQSTANQSNSNQTATNKKKVKKDAIKNSQQFNYQNLNVNLNPKEKIVQDQSIKLKNADGSNTSNQLQFKIVQPDEDGQPSLKMKIAATRKPGAHSELRKLRISNQKLNLNNQTSSSVPTVQTANSTNSTNSAIDQTDSTNKPIVTTQLNSNHNPPLKQPSNSVIQNLNVINRNSNLNPNPINPEQIINQQIVNQRPIDSTNKHQIVNHPNNPTDEHEPNCMCYLHSSKSKKQLSANKQAYLNDKKSRLSSSSSSSSSSSASSRSSSCSKTSGECFPGDYVKSSDGNSSRSSSSSSTYSSSTHSNSSSNSSSSSSSSSSSYSSNCSSRSSSSSSSRSGSCRSCSSSRSSSASSSSSSSNESCNSSNNDIKIIMNRGRSKQKESRHQKLINENLKNDLDQSVKSNDATLSTQQLLNNVNESLMKHEKQKSNLNQLNVSSPFSQNDIPSPLNSNNHLNSQPSSVSCESNCYSPSVSINSPGYTQLRKRDPAERQKLRSYRLPHLTLQQQQQQLLLQQQAGQSKKPNLSNKESKTLNESKASKSEENSKSNQIQDQTKGPTKKIKKQKGGKKKSKLNKKSIETNEEKNDSQNKEIKELKQPKVKKKVKKLKQTGEGKSKKIKKKVKKKGKIDKLMMDLDLMKSKILDPSTLKDLNSSNANSELSKMCLLMNANLNSGIPPNIDTNVILPSLSSLIKEDKNLLIKNQFLISQNLNNKLGNMNLNLNPLPTTVNQESNKSKSNLINKTKESQSTSTASTVAAKSGGKNDKSPDSGIQSQSESPNQLNSQLKESNKKVKKTKKGNAKNESVEENSTQKQTKAQTKSKSDNLKANAIATATSNNQDDNLPKKNSQLINQISSKLPNLQKDPLFNQFMENSMQSLINNLQKAPANFILNNLNSQATTSNPLINSNSSINSIPIKPKSIPSDLITLTEFLLNMKNNPKDANNLNKNDTTNLNLPTTSLSFAKDANLNESNATSQAKESAKKKKKSKSNDLELSKNVNSTNDKLNKKDDFSFKEIRGQQTDSNGNQSKIKNTDLWRNNDIEIANSPLNMEELNKRLRTTNIELINSILGKKKLIKTNEDIINCIKKTMIKGDKQTKVTAKKSTKKSKQNKNEEQVVLNEVLNLNQDLKKNLLSDILCANDLDLDNNSNQQSRSVSSLSQNHYGKSGSKKKKKKHKTKKDGFISELDDEQKRIYADLVDALIRLEVSKSGASKASKSAGVFKCIKYGKGKKNKQKSTIQFSSSGKLQSDDKERQDKTKKRKKTLSYSQQLDQQDDSNLIKLSEDSQNTDNANEHSLPLKKRHHRHTENKCEDDDLIDSSNSSSTELLKINLKTKSTKSTKKAKNESINNELINAANQLESTNAKNSAAISTNNTEQTNSMNKNIVSQINSCLNVTWLNSKQQSSNEQQHTIENASSSENKLFQQASSFTKNRSINVDQNRIKPNSSINSNLDLESDLADDLEMIVIRKNQSNGRKLRSNSNSTTKSIKMGSVKSKLLNESLSVTNGDDLKSDQFIKEDKIEKLERLNKVDKNGHNRLRNNKSNENSNLVQQINDKIKKSSEPPKNNNQNKNSNEDVLKVKPTLTTKKRRKQNKTGFDKPKKRKKIAPKMIEPFILDDKFDDINKEIKVNIDDDKKKIKDVIMSEENETEVIELINHNKKKSNLESKKRIKKDELISLSKNKKKEVLSKTINNSVNKKNVDDLKDNKVEVNEDREETEEPVKESKEIKEPVKSKLNGKKKLKTNGTNKGLKRKLQADDSNDRPVKQIKLKQKKESTKPISNNKSAINKASKKLIKKSTKLINKSKIQPKTSAQIKKLTKSVKSRSRSISEEPIENTPSPANQDDDFEEIVLKIHSVLQTTLVKKPKKDKVKLKGPTKKYLKAGLFSDTFKIDPPAEMPSTTNTSASNTPVHQCETLIEEQVQSDNDESLLMQNINHSSPEGNHTEGKLRFEDKDAQYNGKEPLYTDNDEFSTLLPPPYYVYNKERRKLNDFQLPYDIWWQHVNNQLSHNVNPSKNYKKIKGNVFYDVKPTSNFEEQSCICVKPKNQNQLGCGDDCLNRAMWVECNPNLCPCGDQCSNQRLLKNEWSPGLERFLTRNRGWGVRTTQIIKKSSFIIEYIGEIVSEKVFKDRMAETYSADSHHYCLNITSDILIDGYRLANEGRFVNHSCEPNSIAEKWSVNGYYRVGLFALRDIEPGEEITYDYNFYSYNLEHQQACYCGSSKCRGVIGGKSKRDTAQSKQDASTNLNSMEKLIIVKSILKKSENKRKEGYLSKVENCGTFENTLLSLDKKKLFEIIKPFSYTTTKYIRKHDLFLIRNFEKFRQRHNKNVEKKRKQKNAAAKDEVYYSNSKNQTKKNVFNPLYLTTNPQSRLARTRGYSKVQDNEELIKLYKLCNLFKEICHCFIDKVKDQLKDDKKLEAIFNHLKELPKRKKNENQEIDLTLIERNILSGFYKTEDAFKDEIRELFNNARKHFEDDKSDSIIKELENQFNAILDEKLTEFSSLLNLADENETVKKEKLDDSFESKLSKNQINLSSSLRLCLAAVTQTTKETFKILHDSQKLNEVNFDHLDELPALPSNEQESNQQPTTNFELQQLYNEDELPKFKEITLDETEEIIRCVCTLNREDGTMIQCDQCNCWAHAHCMQADLEAESYLCEKCNPREIDLEIKLEKQPADIVEGSTYYYSLTIGNNIIKIGDTVYLERDKIKNQGEQLLKKNSVTFTDFDGKKKSKADVDIFKIEFLYKTADGKKFVSGYHYLRPSETYHEPTRKFFNNEVLCSPIGGCAQLEAVKGICHVLDLSSYCKGRPKGAREEDVYICEFKVCKKARSFSKVSKNSLGVNTKPYCFNYFEERLYPKRTFSPHNITTVKKDNKTNAKQQSDKPAEKPKERNQAPQIEQIELTETDIANINKLHIRTYVQKQFNINKIVEKITKLNEINSLDNQEDDKMKVDN